MDTIERFWLKVDKSAGDDGCWLWTSSKDRDGYGKFVRRVDGRPRQTGAHRFSFELTGATLGALFACHRCDVPACVNPAHIFPGTAGDNVRDAANKARMPCGSESNPRRLLSDDDVRAIRAACAAGENYPSVAKRYPVSRTQIGRVARRLRYGWVTG